MARAMLTAGRRARRVLAKLAVLQGGGVLDKLCGWVV
jgi:hypothetical protein